jgi:hypothetical protein
MPPSPDLLLCDTDSLIQLFLTASQTQNLIPLRTIRDDYGVQPMIVAEVETEVMWTRRYSSRFVPALKKALGNGLIEVLDESSLARRMQNHLARSVFASCQAAGKQYSKYTDPGEAHTLGSAVTLNAPALSNDKRALDALEFNGMQLPSPVLRVFDLFCFAYQIGALDDKECDKVRKTLVQLKEGVPRAFRASSFSDGLGKFCPRILDSAVVRVGMPSVAGPAYAAQIFVTKKIRAV